MELMRMASRALIALTVSTGCVDAAHAKATAEELARLGKETTCMGADKAGSPSGVAEFAGKWLGVAPGMAVATAKPPSDPYGAERPLLTITAQNMAAHADRLSEGQKGMFRKHPASFKMHVYPVDAH